MLTAPEHLDDDALHELLERAGKGSAVARFRDGPGGGNNRVFLVETGADRYIAKWYFSHPADTRDRLHAEYAFLQYAQALGRTDVPTPLAILPERRLALYEYISGEKLAVEDIRATHVDQAASFLCALNGPERLIRGSALPSASEARFSIAGQIEAVDGRVARLADVSDATPEDRDARDVVANLRRLMDTFASTIAKTAVDLGLDPEAELSPSSRCVSPSDFGFHNALQRPDGTLCFLDFEYAGWDDPAKMICDFFWQPAVPVPRTYFDGFLRQCVAYADDADRLMSRARLLMPLFGVKWVCIVLNEFLPAAAQRRRFANAGKDPQARKRAQIAKARRLIDSLNN